MDELGGQGERRPAPVAASVHSARNGHHRVAVIIPCYNDGATLPDAVASVGEQEACELVVVDDGSNDPKTIQVLAELKAAGTNVVRQPNQGPGIARRRGLTRTTAPYVFAFDADDILAPRALDRLADALDADTDAALAWGDVQMFGATEVLQRGPRSFDPWLMTYLNELIGASTLVRRTCLVQAGWRLAKGFENWDMWLSFCERGWAGVYVPGVVLRYRRSDDGSRLSSQFQNGFNGLYADLQARHPRLFEQRRELWRSSTAPLRLRFALPVIERMPVEPAMRQRLGNVISHPLRPLAVRWSRRRRARLE